VINWYRRARAGTTAAGLIPQFRIEQRYFPTGGESYSRFYSTATSGTSSSIIMYPDSTNNSSVAHKIQITKRMGY